MTRPFFADAEQAVGDPLATKAMAAAAAHLERRGNARRSGAVPERANSRLWMFEGMLKLPAAAEEDPF